MKPKIFIGSSGETLEFASAIHAELQAVAECTPWDAGAFGLTDVFVESLMKNLRESDFGIFIFAADDVTDIRGDLLNVPRDNAVFEAGMFSGYLGPKRCFIVIPQDTQIHVPSDLLGITLGRYEDKRGDDNYRAAVHTFCNEVKRRLRKDGFFRGAPHETLREMCVEFDCCSWIKDEDERVNNKREICSRIEAFCGANTLNKARLLMRHSTGYYMALFSAIRAAPEPRDCELITKLQPKHLPRGFAYYKLMDAAEILKANGRCTTEQLSSLHSWLRTLPDPNDNKIAKRINTFLS